MTMTNINLYGDKLLGTSGRHGADISSQRMDELDRTTIVFAAQMEDRECTAVDLGCGSGAHGLRLAALGLKSILIDQLPIEQTVLGMDGLVKLLPLSYLSLFGIKAPLISAVMAPL